MEWKLIRRLAVATFVLFSSSKIKYLETTVYSSGITIDIRKNTPPLAAIEDDFVTTENFENIPQEIIAKKINLQKIVDEKFVTSVSIDNSVPVDETKAMVAMAEENFLTENNIPVRAVDSLKVDRIPAEIKKPAQELSREEWVAFLRDIPKSMENPQAKNDISTRTYYPNNKPSANPSAIAKKENSGASTATDAIAFNDFNKMNKRPTILNILNASSEHAALLRGFVVMTKGAAITGPNQKIEVYREQDGQTLEIGFINTKTAEFEIQVAEMQGNLVADVLDENDQVLARAKVLLEDLLTSVSPNYRWEGVVLPIQPLWFSWRAKVYDLNQFVPSRAGVSLASVQWWGGPEISETNQKGIFEVESIQKHSQIIARYEKEKFLPTVCVQTIEGQSESIPLISEEYITALKNILKKQYPQLMDREAERKAIVWGSVDGYGAEKEKIEVELSSSSASQSVIGPIYLNQMQWPDTSLKFISAKGSFVFLNVEPGMHLLRYKSAKPVVGSKKIDQISQSQIIMAEAYSVSYARLQLAEPHKVQIGFVDAVTNAPVEATVLSGLPNEKAFEENQIKDTQNGKINVSLKVQNSNLMIEAKINDAQSNDAQSNEEKMDEAKRNSARMKSEIFIRSIVSTGAEQIKLPTLSAQWFKYLSSQLGHSLDKESAVFGRLPGCQCEINITPSGSAYAGEIQYLDQNGRLIEARDHQTPRHAFFIWSLPTELTNITIRNQQLEQIQTQLAIPEVGVLSVLPEY